MEITDYCNYDLSLALKACGFNELTNSFYDEASVQQGEFEIVPTYAKFNEVCRTPGCECVSAPTLAQAQKWLREKLLLNIGVNPAIPTLKWQFYIDDLNQHINPHDGELMTRWDDEMQEKADERLYDSYEQALIEGIKSALELIKEGE